MTYAAEAGTIQFALTGDSLITRPMSMYDEPDFLDLVNRLRGADVAITNTEMLFHDYEASPTFVPGGTYMRAAPQIIDELQWMGINLAGAANNHAYDFGEQGLRIHLDHLRSSGLAFAGIGRNMGEAREPTYLETKVGRVALIAMTSSGPTGLYAQHQWRDGLGRPGANMIRHTSTYVVDDATFDALRRFRDDFGLSSRLRSGPAGNFRNHSWGMSDQPDTDGEFFLGDLQNDWRYPAPNGYRVARGAEPHITLVPNRSDLEENLQRVSDARRSADWVVVSMHNHEQGLSIDDPSDVATDVAHAVIDAGADVFHGHGPHRDRGIEIYKGRPIFYSIGHFVFENETVARVPMDNMVRQGLTRWESTPADFYDSRSGAEWSDEWRGHAAHAAGWRDFVAFVRFSAGRLSEVLLQPIDLGFKRPRYMRGRPMIARGQTAVEVVQLMQRLSEPFGTKVELDGEVGRIVL